MLFTQSGGNATGGATLKTAATTPPYYPFHVDSHLYDVDATLNPPQRLTIRSVLESTTSTQDFCTFEQWTRQPNPPGLFRIFTIVSVLSILVVLVVFGNALVIAAVVLRRRLRSATGYLILSLAVADLLVGCIVLPFSIANEVLNSFWIFGDIWCTVWLTIDIWMCTASIYNLVAISIDRYIAIIKPLNYPMLITKFRARLIVVAVWLGSFIICSPSFLLASSEKKISLDHGVIVNKEACRCTPSNSGMAYILFSASSSFYAPMIVVVFVYARIYIAACAASKSAYCGMMQVTAAANKNPKSILMQNPSALSKGEMPVLRVHRGSNANKLVPPAPTLLSTSIAGEGREANNVSKAPVRSSLKPEHPGPVTSVPISINSSTVPSVYAQMNGSSHSLQCLRKRGSFGGEATAQRCRSGGASPRGSMINLRVTDDDYNGAPDDGGAESVSPSQWKNTLFNKNKELKRTWLQRGDNNNCSGAAATACCGGETMALEMKLTSRQTNEGGPADEEAEQTATLLSTKERATAAAEKVDALHPLGTTLPTAAGSTPNMAYLHPDSAKQPPPTKKRNYSIGVLAKIIRRGPKKKVGCAYEKRLSLEIKAAKTVAIVTGCFIFCWLGFSILYVLSFTMDVNEVVWSIVFWLGYLNSALNPVIYTVFNREFRTCFKKLLTCNQLIFSNGATNQGTTMYNSYNSQFRYRQPGYSSISAPANYGKIQNADNALSSPPTGGNNSNNSVDS